MQRAVITISFLMLALGMLAQSKGDTLYVAAHSGLNLRTEPGTKATKLAAIPREGQVIVLADVDSSLAHSVTEFPGFSIKGFWVEVDYKGQVGYVFSGYLSGFVPAKLITYPNDEAYYEDFIDYLLHNYAGDLIPIDYGNVPDTCISEWSTKFTHGISYTLKGLAAKGVGL